MRARQGESSRAVQALLVMIGCLPCLATYECSTDGGAGPGEEDCSAEVEALADELALSASRSCTGIVRIDFETLSVLGWQIVCGEPGTVTQEQARQQAELDVDLLYGDFTSGSTLMLNPPDPEDEWVFEVLPGDYGGFAAVSAATGLTVYGGSIVWMGGASHGVMHPADWRGVEEIGSGCEQRATTIPVPVSYCLTGEVTPTEDEIERVLGIAAGSALPAAMERDGAIDSVVVVMYPSAVGMFVPAAAEWGVLFNASARD